MNANVQIKEIPTMQLAYVSCLGPQNLQEAYGKLFRWATPQGLLNEETKMLTIYHDSFKVTTPEKVRMSAGMMINSPVEIAGEIRLTSLKPRKCIVANFTIDLDEFEKSWTGLFLWAPPDRPGRPRRRRN